MFPKIPLFGLSIDSYDLFMVLGIFAFVLMFYLIVIKRENLPAVTTNRLFYVSIAGIAVLGIFAAFFDALFHIVGDYMETGVLTIKPYGITWLGGVVACIPATILLIHFFVPGKKGDAVNTFSLLVPGIVIGHALGRVGCFYAGCCYGMEVDSFLSVTFPGMTSAVLPVQLFEALFEVALFIVMIALYDSLKKYNVELYCYAYGVFRFGLEFLRGDDRGATGFILTPAQFLCVLMWIAATALLLWRKGLLFKSLLEKCEAWQREASEALAEANAEKAQKSPELAAATATPSMNTAMAGTSEKDEVLKALQVLKDAHDNGFVSDEAFEQKQAELKEKL